MTIIDRLRASTKDELLKIIIANVDRIDFSTYLWTEIEVCVCSGLPKRECAHCLFEAAHEAVRQRELDWARENGIKLDHS